MSFPVNTTILDNFNRANSNGPGSTNWSLAHSFAGTVLFNISSNQAAPNSADYVVGYWNPATYGPDCEVYATMNVVQTIANDGPYLCARLQQVGTGTLDGYALAVESSGTLWKIMRITNGVFTTLGAAVNGGIAAGNKFGLEIIGSTLNAYRYNGTAWSLVLSRTDTTYPNAGYFGLYLGADQQTTRLDDFGGGVIRGSMVPPNISSRMKHLLVR